eukprot:TRINITY_DN1443_c0_g2_i1.p1 TRINITY_DN1443_c0_g2~~TRINITY_DN1443_c0_g2_i1.p1  ORF type:complete len:181 (-),score=41.21 TRINITY_DN1443_c0_g2_i1:36-578(-)
MTTITFPLVYNFCSSPTFSRDWSIHLDGRLSQQELDGILYDLEAHWRSAQKVNRIWGLFYLFFALIIIPLAFLADIFVYVGFVSGYVFVSIIYVVFVIIRMRKLRRCVEAQVQSLNQIYGSRGLHFRFPQIWARRYHNVQLEIEIAGAIGYAPTHLQVPQYTQSVPSYFNGVAEKQPLLA